MKVSTSIGKLCVSIFPLDLSSSVGSDRLACRITLKSIVKKSKWSWTSTTKTPKPHWNTVKHPEKFLNSYQLLIDMFLFSFFFSPPKVRRLLKFGSTEKSGWVHAPRLQADVGYCGRGALLLAAPSLDTYATAAPAGGNAITQHPASRKLRGQVRWPPWRYVSSFVI